MWGAWPGACRAQDAPAADRLRLLELRLDRLPAGETLACYASGDALLVPLAALARPLGLAIEVDATGTRARGCVIRPERGLEVDATRGTAVVDGRASRFAPARAETHDGDLCVDARLLAEWLPLDIAADSLAGTLEVTSREVLPVTARRLRAQRAALLRVPAMRDHPPYPRVAPSYGWLSVPFVDQDVRALAQRGPLGTAGALELRTHAAGDVLGCEGHLFASTLAGAGGGPVRATLGRKDDEGRLLGPLRATQFAVGEVLDAGLSDLTAARAGTGLTLGNAPLTQASEFDRHRFAGLLEPGWEVELYRNGALLAYQGADVAETYEFDDVALDYGVNEFELRFYGPQGQERVERQVYAADADMARSGALTYRLTAAALHDGTPRAALGLDWGLARRVAMGLRLATARLEGVEHRYAEASLRAVQGRVVYELAGLGDARGGSGARASAHARWTALGVDLDHFESRRLATETSDLGPGGRQGRTTLRVYSRVRVPFMAGAPLSLEARPERLRGDRSQDQVITRATLAGRWLSLAHEHRAVAMRARGPALASASATDRLVASGRLRALTVRGRVEYDPRSPVRVRTSSLVLERHRASGGFAELGLERRSAVDETHLLAGLAAPLRVCALTARLDYGGRGRASFEAGLRFGLGYEPRSRRLVASPQRLADQGALSVHAFVDANGNGVADPGEAPVQGAELLVNSVRGGARTDAHGYATLTRLPSDQAVDVAVLERSLEDPAWVLERPGLRVVPHAGHVVQVEVPVAVSSEISGTVYARGDSARAILGGVGLELVDALGGRVVARAASAYDGFYDLAGIPPGRYRLRVAQPSAARYWGPEVEVDVPPSGALLDRLDLDLTPVDRVAKP